MKTKKIADICIVESKAMEGSHFMLSDIVQSPK